MSQPTIYWFGGTGMTSNRYGFRGDRMKDNQGYIKFDDYAALAAENERLKAIIVDECYGSDAYRKHENEAKRLTAENERLRKAGDALAKELATAWAATVSELDETAPIAAWLAAKEGRDAK